MIDVGFLDLVDITAVPVPFSVTGVAVGAQALLQQAMLLMFVSKNGPGRYMGGGLTEYYGSANISESGLPQFRNMLDIAVAETKDIIKNFQASMTGLTDEERMYDMKVNELTLLDPVSLRIVIDVITVSGAVASGLLTVNGDTNATA